MRGRIILVAALLALAAAGVGTYAWAAAADGGQTINACVGNDGKLRLQPAGTTCKEGETGLSWNTVGPAGPAGPAGAPGPAGPQGQPGAAGGAAADPDATSGTIDITAQRQGELGGAPLPISSLSHEILSPRDASSGLPTGKRVHKPITVTMHIDKATPQLMQALVTNEDLTKVLIALSEPGESIELAHAGVSDVTQHGNEISVSFVYQKITWTVDGATATDELGLQP